MIIGLTGKAASGKGEVAKFLVSRGFTRFCIGEEVKEEMRRQGVEFTTERRNAFLKKIHREHGPAYFAEKLLRQLDPDKSYVIDSIRHPAEVEILKKQNFHLISISAKAELRLKRLNDKSVGTLNNTLDSGDLWYDFIDKTDTYATVRVENNSTLFDLHEKMKEIILTLAKESKRPSWDDYFMGIAQMVALRGNCMKRKVAAVVVKEQRIISTGYNGTPRGITNCSDGGCPRCNSLGESGVGLDECLCSHAEENSIVQAAYHGISIKGSTLYTTLSPCLSCTKMIINAGIAEVVYSANYTIQETPLRLLKEAGILTRQLKK